MDREDDIARLLPEAPPPRPARRAAAIDTAMRRFDGLENPVPADAPRRPRWQRPGRVQIGAFASIALVALIGVPIALTSLEHRPPAGLPAPSATTIKSRAPVSPDTSNAPAKPALPTAPAPTPPVAPQARVQTPTTAGVVREPRPVPAPEAAAAPQLAPLPPPPPPPAPVAVPQPQAPVAGTARLADKDLVVTGTQIRRAAPAGTDAVAAIAQEDRSVPAVVVTGAKVRGRTAANAQRGDWNACTVNDPAHSLRDCKQSVNPAAKGGAGIAAAHVADGLSRAWDGDIDGAIAAFGEAIAVQPRLATAYLNRGLAYQRQGDFARALADFDRAIRYAPNAARGYYSRARLLRDHGDPGRAGADEARAVELDPDYEAVVK